MERCTFDGCMFFNIGLVGTPDIVEAFRSVQERPFEDETTQ